MATIVKAPQPFKNEINRCSISLFLAGSIEMGKAENWQEKIENIFKDDDILILNPRRDDWDSSWIQSIKNEQFRTQVQWELEGQEIADYIFMYFSPETKSPITLLELGLATHSNKTIVCCPEGFWRKGNVEVVCDFYEIPLFDNQDKAIDYLKNTLK